MGMSAHGYLVDRSNTPENASVIPDFICRGAVLRMREPEGPRAKRIRRAHEPTPRALRII